ncbi:MAG: hypothetical protein IJZ53_01910 [Tyzzerella sp.]|nr:hypothetical protein [Tyzzerella sp.]
MNNITRKRYSLNKFGFEEYTEHEVKNFSNGRTFFAKNEQDIVDYVKEYVHKKPYSRILIGKIGKDLANRIYADTEVDLTNYNVAITSEFENSHANEQKERNRGQVPITPEIVAKLPELISEYDNVSNKGYNKQQQKVLKFEKNINGRKIAIEYVSKGRKTIDLQTMYGWENEKEKNSHQASYANAHDRTSETNLDMSSSTGSISENGEKTTKTIKDVYSIS